MLTIPRCYDSHVHLFGTGQVSSALALQHLQHPSEVQNLQVQEKHYRGEWLVGFGWDQNAWTEKPHLKYLDARFPQTPVSFLRADGHAVWVNSEALRRLKLNKNSQGPSGGRLERDAAGELCGVLVDTAKDLADAMLPDFTEPQQKIFAKEALEIFNRAGFTHLRDMTSQRKQFEILQRMDHFDELTAYLELNFFAKDFKDFEIQLKDLQSLRGIETKKIRLGGIKIFYDGALGSEGALLSRCYCGSENKGLRLWDLKQVEEIFRKTWGLGFPVAIHCIGDEASAEIATLALRLKREGLRGDLHLEHVEILRPETLDQLQELKPICHMQPSHWLSDHHWLRRKIGDLDQYAFPWKALEEKGVSIYFGSDAPIAMPSLASTRQALEESAKLGVPALVSRWEGHHSHPDLGWGGGCRTEVGADGMLKVILDGQTLQTIQGMLC